MDWIEALRRNPECGQEIWTEKDDSQCGLPLQRGQLKARGKEPKRLQIYTNRVKLNQEVHGNEESYTADQTIISYYQGFPHKQTAKSYVQIHHVLSLKTKQRSRV